MAVNGSNSHVPCYLSSLASAHADLGQFDDAWRCIGEAMTMIETTKETWLGGRGQSHCRENRTQIA